MKTLSTLSLMLLLATIPALAALTVTFDGNNLDYASGITDTQPRAGLAGTFVTFSFFGGPPSLTATFDASGNAISSNPNVSLTMSPAGIPNTNLGIWTITNNTTMLLNSITIVGYGPNSAYGTIFDRTNPSPGTLGSGPDGQDVTCNGPCPPLNINANYTRPIIVGASFGGDLYGELQITISNGALGIPGIPSFSFFADTDLTAPVPEPGSMALLGVGLAGLFLVRRRG